MKYWIAMCSSCGSVKVTQKSKPTSCKEQVRTGERSIRRCGNELTAQQDVPAKSVAAKAAQMVCLMRPRRVFDRSIGIGISIMKTCKPKQQNLSWTRKVEQVLRKLKYQRARKHQWGSFWSVGIYGLLWNTFCEV